MLRLTALAASLIVHAPVQAQPNFVAKATSPTATFSAQSPGTTGFRVLPQGAELPADQLLVTLPGATLESRNNAVSLRSFADYDGRSPLPILETALTLNVPTDCDLDFTLDRGRVDVTNRKTDGAATVWVRFRDQSWKLTLDSPGARVALEMSGRWPSGVRFRRIDPKEEKPIPPVGSLLLLVLNGSASVKLGDTTLALRAPVGGVASPALLEWDSLDGTRPQAQKLERLPEWADLEAGLSEEGRRRAAVVEKLRAARANNPTTAVETFLSSTDPVEQRVGLVFLGATDDLDRLVRELNTPKAIAQWEFSVSVLRHWIGRGAGQDQKLYVGLTERGFSPAQASTVLQLLLGFTEEELGQPETYEVLIAYLRHPKSGIRTLAAWHLMRLCPKGKDIPYKPGGTDAEAEATASAWQKLIPRGALPPVPEKKN